MGEWPWKLQWQISLDWWQLTLIKKFPNSNNAQMAFFSKSTPYTKFVWKTNTPIEKKKGTSKNKMWILNYSQGYQTKWFYILHNFGGRWITKISKYIYIFIYIIDTCIYLLNTKFHTLWLDPNCLTRNVCLRIRLFS